MKNDKILRASRTTILLLALFACLQYGTGCASVAEKQTAEKKQAAGVKQDTEDVNGCDYFNGEVVKITENGLALTPVSEWKWSDAAKVRIPQTKLFEGDYSDIKPGDKIRVAFNGNTMEWSGDEVSIRKVFLLFRVSDDATLE